jgi:hypothetical protein
LPLEKFPVNPHRLNAARIIRFQAFHQITDGINFQRIPAFERTELVRMLKRLWQAKPKAKLFTAIR